MKQEVSIEKAAVDRYWLACLLTGRRDISVDIAADASTAGEHENPFSPPRYEAGGGHLIGNALTAIQDEFADSAQRTKQPRVGGSAMPSSRK